MTLANLRKTEKVPVAKKRFAINKMGSLKEVFVCFNIFIGILKASDHFLSLRVLISD